MMDEIGLNENEPRSTIEEVRGLDFQKFCDIMGLEQNSNR